MAEFSVPDRSSPAEGFTLYKWLGGVVLLVALLGLLGNLLVLWLLGFLIRRNPVSVYVLNLAAAEALFLCGHSVLCLGDLLDYFERSPAWMGVNDITEMAYSAALSLRAATCAELCLSALCPRGYRRRRPQHTSTVVCGGLWVLACLLLGGHFLFCLSDQDSHFCNPIIIGQMVHFFLFTALLFLASLAIVLKVQCSGRRRRRPPRLYRLALIMALVFLLFGLAPDIEHFLETFGIDVLVPLWLPTLLANLNCSANPVLYFALNRRRRRGRRGREPLRRVLQRALTDEQDLEGDERDASHTTTWETSF
ncbi:mas-related G-protein coupled receptor member X2-like [Gracilinanus agilis]|uniref:mas-related G-protein coupled receptor member X2-like n=1 Tax=Gracilinanus agilis TaxID=191870 RepID=UPI001CFE5085|nr:mas-related G-protein coupled receptor member X2-like [Gracilinanus agilis]